ncbi:hypothetical protein ABTX82_01855 [Streptomyces lavendulae]|uniref:hypothetical protein n=1 Tax=Streptomyces lavendulae TaxID=1914 RepID=UPI00331F7FDC
MAITVGSVEVDVIPNTRGIYNRLRSELVPAATRAGEEAGSAAGRSFGPAMQRQVAGVGLSVGEEIGRQIASRVTAAVRDALRTGIVQGGREAQASAVRQGDETGGAFSRALKARLEVAFRSLPKLQVGASTSEADADLQALRTRMETLAGKRIGIDIDAEAAKVEIRYLEAELERLGARHPNVQVRADTASARAQLALVRAEIDAVDGKRARIDVDTAGALSAVLQLTVAIGGLAAIPAIPVLAAGIGAIGAAATAAAAGVGALAAVAAPAIIGIAGALQAQKAAQEAAAAATMRGGQADAQAASRALQMAGAQQALATAERNGARQIAQAQQQVQQAKTAAADAITQAAQRNAQAARQVVDAEKALAQSQRDARQAQKALTDARKEAGRELEDLANQYIDAQLSQRDAALSVEEAQQRLASVTARGSKASALEREQAQLAYEQAVQRLREQTTDTERLKEKQEAAAKSGVEGTSTYKQAQEQLAQAQQTVADKAQAVKDAQAEAARTQVETARQVADAQERVGEAIANVAVAQQSAADAVAGAQRQIASAAASAAGGVDQAAIAQAKYQEALSKLTPAARGTFDAFLSLRTAFKSWSESLQPAVMPLFTRALEGIKNSLPGLTPFVLAAAKAIGILQDKVSAGFKSPWWQSFRDDLAKAVLPAIVGLGVAFGNVFKTLGGIVDAFLPHMDGISNRLQTITGRWATWATNLKGSDKFEQFLAYSSTQAPILAKAVGEISSAFFEVSRAVAPLSGPVLTALGAVATAIGSIANTLPWLLQLLYGVWAATKLWTLAMLAFNLVMNANPIVLIITGIVALVAAVIYAYQHWGWFRDTVNDAWNAIKTGASYVWSILQPILAAIWTGLKILGDAAIWLWTNAISPAFTFIWNAARFLFTILAVVLIGPIVVLFKILGALAMWLWTNAIKPAFEFIGAIAVWLWNVAIKPAFDGIMVIVRNVGDIFSWLWANIIRPVWNYIGGIIAEKWAQIKLVFDVLSVYVKNVLAPLFMRFWNDTIKPAWDGIKTIIASAWNNGIKPIFDLLKHGVENVRDSFNTAITAIGIIWDRLKEITRKPVQFVVDTVYNNGIRKVWNTIADFTHVDKLDPVRFAEGGRTHGGTPGKDSIPALMMADEYVIRRDSARKLGYGTLDYLNQYGTLPGFAAGGPVQRFKDGGVVGWIKGAVGSVGEFFGDMTELIANPGKAWTAATGFIRDKIATIAGTGFGKLIASVPTKILSSLKDKVTSVIGSFGGGADAGGSGVQRWAPVVLQALAMLGQPANLLQTTLRRMDQESGGNPNIVNKWDSNWLAGYPSVGLMQVIGPTFQAYAGALREVGPFLYGTSVNPLANVYSSMRYAMAAYGSLPRAYNQPGGYDSGGYLQPGMNLAYNGTGRPEPVLTTAQWNTLAASGSAGQKPADQRSYNWTLVGSHMTPGEQMAEMERRMSFAT